MRRKAIAIIIIAAVSTLTTVSDADRMHESGQSFSSKVESLRLAIEDLSQTFGDQYPDGRQYLKQLPSIEEKGFPTFHRQALLANPLVSGQPLLYVVRAPDEDGTHTYVEPYRFRKYGSALKVIDLSMGRTVTIVETAKGIIRNPCVHFDGRRVLFAMSGSRQENFNIFEVAVDLAAGSGSVKQLTNASDVSDVDPIYLPDDSIVFASSRDLKFVPCDTQIVPQLFRMSPDGTNIHQITRSTAHENQISLMPDGRILYSRWDYVDRNFGDGHGFWVTNPDG
ncbi:MAG: TolB family protein, partial [Planctomycetota bacterium]